MTYSNKLLESIRLSSRQNSLLLIGEEAKTLDVNSKLLLPNSTRSLKRRTSLLEKSRDWTRRLITLHRSRRNTISNEKISEKRYKLNETKESSYNILHNYQKNFDEDGYLSPTEVKAKLDNINGENSNYRPYHSKLSTNSQSFLVNSNSSSNVSQRIYRYHDPNIRILTTQHAHQQQTRLSTTSFVSEFQKSLSIFDYIDLDVSDESSKQDDYDDSLESLKYLFNDDCKSDSSRRLLRRSTNASSISTDSGYSDMPLSSSSKLIPVHLISCTLIPVNVTAVDSTNICYTACTCHQLSSACSSNEQERKLPSYSSHSHFFRQPLSCIDRNENCMNKQCACNKKYYSTATIYPSSSVIPTRPITKFDDSKEVGYYQQQRQHTLLKTKRPSLKRFPSITDDLTSVSRWYRPYRCREEVYDALQQADYGAFILRNSITHLDCYALSIKVPKFTHESNIVHYLIEKTIVNNNPNYRIKGTTKQFPTLLSLLIHHSVMPEILPITLNLNDPFTIWQQTRTFM